MPRAVVIMGVAGCGKSSLAAAVALAEGLPLVEGDNFHSPANRAKMAAGVALNDADRSGWLDALALQLQGHPGGVVLTCSALRLAYRERLRAAAPGLRFAFLELGRDAALARVVARGGIHFFSPQLVESQFATLESPAGESGVLRLDALQPVPALQSQVSAWLHTAQPG